MKRAGTLFFGLFLMAPAGVARLSAADPEAAQVARGKYLVEGVSLCGDCHTPRNEKGEFDRSKWLQGAPVHSKPPRPGVKWAEAAPRLAGFPPGWSGADVAKLLETGISRDGKPPDPPMPHYKLTPRDALAVVAYLKSLKAPEK